MRVTRKELKARAKESMAWTKPSYLLIGAIMVAAVNAESWLSAIFGGGAAFEYGTYEELMEQMEQYMASLSIPLQLASVALALFVGVLTFGFMRYCLRLSRGEKEVGVDELVSAFPMFWKVVGLNLYTGLLTFLWGLCAFIGVFSVSYLIVGRLASFLCFLGSVAIAGLFAYAMSFRYRMAPLLLIDHPDWSIGQCVRESNRLMKGEKLDLFVLDCSFIGWRLISLFCAMMTFVPVMDIWLAPYMQITECHFYNELVQQDDLARQSEASSAGEWWEN